MTIAMGQQASQTLGTAFQRALSPLPDPTVGGLQAPWLRAFGSPDRPQLFAEFMHPSYALGGLVSFQAATDYAAILDQSVVALTGAPPRFSVAAYVAQHGLTEDRFWNDMLQARALRALELFRRHPTDLEECPASVQEAVAMAFVPTQQGFLDQRWTPKRSTTRVPFSALCFYLSDMGMRGGRESAHQAQLQAEHIDPTAQLMGIDLRLLGIPASDMRVRSEEEVDEMLADIRELRREWGRLGGLESSRRANEQAAEMRLLGVHLRFLGIGSNDRRELSEQEVDEMLADFRELCREWGRLGGLESNRRANDQAARLDSSGRLLGVHLRILRIDSNDTRPRSEEEVTDLLLHFREASGLARSTWTEEEDELLDEIIAENPALAEPGAIIPAGLYVHEV